MARAVAFARDDGFSAMRGSIAARYEDASAQLATLLERQALRARARVARERTKGSVGRELRPCRERMSGCALFARAFLGAPQLGESGEDRKRDLFRLDCPDRHPGRAFDFFEEIGALEGTRKSSELGPTANEAVPAGFKREGPLECFAIALALRRYEHKAQRRRRRARRFEVFDLSRKAAGSGIGRRDAHAKPQAQGQFRSGDRNRALSEDDELGRGQHRFDEDVEGATAGAEVGGEHHPVAFFPG